MSKSKEYSEFTRHNASLPITNCFNAYPEIMFFITDDLPNRDVFHLSRASTCLSQFFKPCLDKRLEASYVTEGNVIPLMKLAQLNPSRIFMKHNVIPGPRRQKYFNVSLYQLMTFLCDDDMKRQVMGSDSMLTWLKEQKNEEKRREQYEEIACGGADLIKMNRDPLIILREKGFSGLTHFRQTYIFHDNTRHELTFPLLENTDGIVCYQSANEEKSFFYYVNQKDQTLERIDIYTILKEDEDAFAQLMASFDGMENNSSRRSNLNEHRLVERVFGYSLVQKGILYEEKGKLYRDYRTPFNLVNAYRKCIRLYENKPIYNGRIPGEGHQFWINGVGEAQGEELWLLQRVFENDRPFYPLDKQYKGFARNKLEIDNWIVGKKQFVLSGGFIHMSDFAIQKGGAMNAMVGKGGWGTANGCKTIYADFVAICWLIENAKANVMESKPREGLESNCINFQM